MTALLSLANKKTPLLGPPIAQPSSYKNQPITNVSATHASFPHSPLSMDLLTFFSCTVIFSLSSTMTCRILATNPSCNKTCGSLQVKYPLGTGPGCGAPRFQPFVSCSPNDQLTLTTHTGSYPITSISYSTSTLTITPPLMSTCSSMHTCPNFGIDWATPFQLGPSIFLLLSCTAPTSSLTRNGTPLCDSSNAHLCAAIYTCPSVASLGLPLFAPTNTCCVYSPASLGPRGDLDLQGLKCAAYSSVASLGDYPMDPSRWEYGVVLDYSYGGGGIEGSSNNYATACDACEKSEGVCGYAPPKNYFICVCNNGVNTTSDCFGQAAFLNTATQSPYSVLARAWWSSLVVFGFWLWL